ncbi:MULTISPECIES: DISARM system phospholipase D-like protein DrmC [Microbacterium]|jgi:phosphatidylserine/phosphatidylglycerophosphate/cardiolipin synthase-like enzyme|uniref:DISARM system phospholipase D-like protein DrmC n=1 Tax=Microbacterium TaxID=33882 RepID=UPI001D178B6B|nr:DISARM system phospholipase D-like protein DrmC [Microbacterium testaceum]MCC4249342.1 DISARM system phospholipase D-like protein DrmC [Microbacterium testaceum]
MASDPLAELGSFLTATEAERLAMQFGTGTPISVAVREIAISRREHVRELLAASGIAPSDRERAVSVLRAIAGAKTVPRELTPVWTMPGNEANIGHLTSEFHRIVGAARQSVTAATYNFQDTSQMWTALKAASDQPGVVVTVYVDAGVADAATVKVQLPGATVYRSALLPNGKQVISHAKFIVVDHELLLITSANFSFSAENRNIEFGILIRDTALAASVETTMRSKHGSLYELVP